MTLLIGLHQVAAFISPWIIIYFAGSVGGETEIGRVSYWMAIATPVAALSALPSRNFMLTNNNYSDVSLYFSRICILAVLLLPFIAVGYFSENSVLPAVIFAVKAFEFLFDIPLSKSIKSQDNKAILKLFAVRVLAIVLPFIAALYHASLDVMVATMCLGFLIGATVCSGKGGNAIENKDLLASLALSVSAFFIAIESNIPRYVLGMHDEMRVLAIFTTSAFVVTGVSVAVNVLIQSSLNELANNLSGRKYKETMVQMLKLFGVSLIIWLAIYPALLVPMLAGHYFSLYGITYGPMASNILYITAVFGLVSIIYSLSAAGVMATRQYVMMLYASIFFALFSFASSVAAYHTAGYVGALWACLFVLVVHSVYFFYRTYRSALQKGCSE